MNKYIKTDIEQGLQYLKIGVMNALADIESGEENEISLGGPIALSFIIKCAEERGWKEDPDMDMDWTNGWQVDYWYYTKFPNKNIRLMVYGSLLEGNTSLIVNDDDE